MTFCEHIAVIPMGEDAKKQYVTVTGEGLTIHGWRHVTILVGHISLHWAYRSLSVHREAQGDNWPQSLGTATIQRCAHSCRINSVGWFLQATQHLHGQWFQLE
eukprot:4649386-Amphidinium_carterae.1